MFDLQGYGASVMEGLYMTVAVGVCSLLIALLLGIAGALAKLSKSRVASGIAGSYTTVIRGIPDLVLMFLIFYGGQIMVNNIGDKLGWDYIDINPFLSGVITIGFIFGAYMTETFRGAILAVPHGQMEAAYAYGMTKFQAFSRILFPQMVRHAIPSFGNNWLVLLKTTALVSVIGLDDLLRKADMAGKTTKMPFTFYVLAAVVYLVLTSISILIMGWLKRRYSAGVKEA